MNDRTLARGLFLMAIALIFGLSSLKYQMGDFSRAGPGLFPAMVSTILGFIALAIIIGSFFREPIRMELHVKNILIILGSLGGFAVISMFLNMIAGIIFMVFFATLAGTTYSWWRNVKISFGLCLMALFLVKLLGMNLPLY